MQGLRHLETRLQVVPTSLVHREKGRPSILRVICNDDTHEEGEPDHAASKDLHFLFHSFSIQLT